MILTYTSQKYVKLKMLLSYYLILGIAIIAFTINGTNKYGGTFKQNLFENLLIGCLFVICLITLPTSWIRKKKFYNYIQFDTIKKTITIGSNGNLKIYNSESLAFSFFNYRNYSVVVLYKRSTGTLGQFYFEELANFTAFFINISWSREQLREISEHLKSLPIEKCDGMDKPILDRIF